MRRVLQLLAQPRHYPWIVLTAAVLVLGVRLGSYGFWEPLEIAVADRASRLLEPETDADADTTEAAEAADETAERKAPEAARRRKPVRQPAPELEEGAEGAAASEPGPSGEPGTGAPESAPSSEPGAAPSQEPGASPSSEPGMSSEPGTAPSPEPDASRPKRPRSSTAPPEPRFTERLVAHGIERLGYTELGALAPALLGLVAVMAAYFLGARLASPRAGVISALVFLSFPLLVLESRQLTSDIGAIAGSSLLFLGLTGLALPDSWRKVFAARGGDLLPAALLAGDVLAVVTGALLSTWSAGLFLGLVPPLAGFGAGALLWIRFERPAERREAADPSQVASARVPLVVGVLALVGAIAALAVFCHHTFTWVHAEEGDRNLFDWTLSAGREALPALGQPMKMSGNVQTPFSALFEHIGFGMFPWIVVAPIALGGLAVGGRAPSNGPRWVGGALFLWAGVAWLMASVLYRNVGAVMYPAPCAIAVGIGLWLEGLLVERERDGASPSLPLVALFVFCGVAVLGKDIAATPEEFTSVTALGQLVKLPEGSRLHHPLVLCGGLVGLALAAGLFFWRGPYSFRLRGGDALAACGRWGIHAAVALGVVFALFVSQVWVPVLANRMSSREVLSAYRDLHADGDTLGILGNLGSGPAFYAGGDYKELKGRGDLMEFLRRPERVFALVREKERCALYKESVKRGVPFHILDNQNVQFLLLSNQVKSGERDLNRLDEVVSRQPPAIGKPVSVMFDDQIELVAVDMPASVDADDDYTATFVYKVHKPVVRKWSVFVHIDGPGGHISGDHDPLESVCPLSTFSAGDYLIDRFRVKPEGRARGTYRIWTGLFYGQAGNFTNMKVTSGNPDKDNRAPIGTITLE